MCQLGEIKILFYSILSYIYSPAAPLTLTFPHRLLKAGFLINLKSFYRCLSFSISFKMTDYTVFTNYYKMHCIWRINYTIFVKKDKGMGQLWQIS
jgi:hypothetical protein